MAVHSLPFMLHPRSPPSVTPWWIASDLCPDTDLASDLKAMDQKPWKPEEELRAGAASKANVSSPSSLDKRFSEWSSGPQGRAAQSVVAQASPGDWLKHRVPGSGLQK